MDEKNFWIEAGEDEIEITVYFDFAPPEPMTRHYPGYDGYIDVCEVRVVETDAEVSLLKDEESSIIERLWEHFEETRYDTAYDIRGY